MEIPDLDYVSKKLSEFQSEYQIEIFADWGRGPDGVWQPGKWMKKELENLHNSVGLLAGALGRGEAG